MSLQVQIQSLIFSFIFGLFFSCLLNLNYHYLMHDKIGFRIVTNILFVLDMVLLYFILLKLINNGILHVYFFICLFLGFLLGISKTKKLRFSLKKKSHKKK